MNPFIFANGPIHEDDADKSRIFIPFCPLYNSIESSYNKKPAPGIRSAIRLLIKIINKTNMKRWTVIFRALANINRLKIIKLLADGRNMSVTDIADDLRISFKGTSNHLALLKNLDVLEAQGAAGHVYYSLNRQLPKDFQRIIEIILK